MGITAKDANVTIVIPNYNGMAFLPGCLKSLENQNCKSFQILMVDNASSDGSVEWMKENYPEIPMIVNKENLGFSGAVNQGIEWAKTEYVILLNNDTEVDPDYVGELLQSIGQSPKIFSVSAKMIRFHERDKMDDAGDLFNSLGWAFQRGTARPVGKYEKNNVRVFSACAGAAIYRKKVFEEIGMFDWMHFAYLEDLDVGYRAKIYGYRNIYCSKAICYHIGSGTSAEGNKYSDFKVKLAARNSVYVNYKNMPMFFYIINAPGILLGNLLKTRYFDRHGFGKAFREGLKEGRDTRKNCKKVPFAMKHFCNYLVIEWEMFVNMWIYTWDYFHR